MTYPSKVWVVDIETYSECELAGKTGVGSWAYARHPSTELLCLVAKEVGAPNYRYWVPRKIMGMLSKPQTFLNHIASRYPGISEWNTKTMDIKALVAHNVQFETDVLPFQMPNVPWGDFQWYDTAAYLAACGFPMALGWGGKAFGLETEKDMEGNAIMRQIMKPYPNRKTKVMERAFNDYLFTRTFDYCVTDCIEEEEAYLKVPHLSDYEQRVYEMNWRVNLRGIPIDQEMIEGGQCLVAYDKILWEKKLSKIEGFCIEDITSHVKVRRFIMSRGVNIANTQKGTMEEILAVDDIDEDVRLVAEAKLAIGGAAVKKLIKMEGMSLYDGRVHNCLIYHKAHTGRFAGELVQPQNLKRPEIKNPEQYAQAIRDWDIELFEREDTPPITKVVSSSLRGMIRAPKGRTFVCSDYSAIEARGAMYIAEDPYLEEFVKFDEGVGAEPYCLLATKAFDREITKANDPVERNIGKVGVLANLYGSGAKAFRDYAMSIGCEMDVDTTVKVHKAFREKHVSIVEMWSLLESAAKQALANPGKIFRARKILFRYDEEKLWLLMKLPSGRKVYYPYPRMRERTIHGTNIHGEPWSMKKMSLQYCAVHDGAWTYVSTYGPKIFENCFSGETLVITSSGAKMIRDITTEDQLWDGVEWVRSDGSKMMGVKVVQRFLGTWVTPDHRILVGQDWRSVLEITRLWKLKALISGLNLVSLKCWTQVSATKAKLRLGAIAERFLKYAQGGLKLTSTPPATRAVVKEKRRNTRVSLRAWNFLTSGLTDIQGLSQDAITKAARHIITMAVVALRSIHRGGVTEGHFLNMLRPWIGGMSLDLISTGSITMGGTNQGISESCRGLKTATIPDVLNTSTCGGSVSRFQTCYDGSAITGQARTRSSITGEKEELTKKSSLSTTKRRVYDVINCGPRRRFTVLTPVGPVIAHNCIQAFCRDLFVDDMMSMDDYTDIVLHVHDEIVTEVAEDKAEAEVTLHKSIMTSEKDFAIGMPIAIETWVGDYYRK